MKSIRLEQTYSYPPDRVWRALTDPQALGQWLMQTDFEPRLGKKFQFHDKPRPGWRGIVDCEVVELEPPRRLAYTWQGDPGKPATLVRWTLEPIAGGTRLVLEHSGFKGIGGFFLRSILSGGWRDKILQKLARALSDADPAPPSAVGRA